MNRWLSLFNRGNTRDKGLNCICNGQRVHFFGMVSTSTLEVIGTARHCDLRPSWATVTSFNAYSTMAQM